MTLHVRVEGAGTPVILIHGVTIDHRMMLPLDNAFRDGWWERHYLDLPGSGRSPRLDHMTAHGVVESVSRYIDETIPGRAFALVGISFGGFVARCLHARYGPRVLGSALLAPAVRPAGRRQVDAEVRPYESDGFEPSGDSESALFAGFRAISPIHTRASWESYVENVVPGFRVHDVAAYQELIQHYDPESIHAGTETSLLGGRNVIVVGKQDALVGWKDQFDVLGEYGNVSYAAIEGAGHNVHLDQPAAVGLLIRDWLTRVEQSAPTSEPGQMATQN